MPTRSYIGLLAICLIACVAIPVIAQERQKKAAPADFPAVIEQAKQAYTEKRFAGCVALLRDAVSLCATEIRKLVLEAMPSAPEGFEKQPPADDAQAAMLGAMSAGLGQVTQQEYSKPDGNGSISITVMADSPMASSFAMLIKMSAMEPGAEVVKYGADSALFKKEGGDSYSINIVLADKHVIEGRSNGLDEERFFKQVFNQQLVDKIRAALSGN